MLKAILSVILQNEIPYAALLNSTVKKSMPEWDNIFVVLDMTERQIKKEKTCKYIEGRFRAAAEFFMDNFYEYSFFFKKNEFKEFVKVTAAKEFLSQYDLLLITNASALLNERFNSVEQFLSQENSSVRITRAKQIDEVPRSFMLNDSYKNSESIFCISQGGRSQAFLKWCMTKFEFLFENGYTSESVEEKSEQHVDFIWNWCAYAPLFDIEYRNTKIDFDIFVPKDYQFDEFTDGTMIHDYLRQYFARDNRLRDNCKKKPFDCIDLFTQRSVFTGDEHMIPITAIEKSIWDRRPDIQSAYPDYKDRQRLYFTKWFIEHAAGELHLPFQYYGYISKRYEEYLRQEDLWPFMELDDISLSAMVKRKLLKKFRRKKNMP